MDFTNKSLAEIVEKLPMASQIFRKHRLDFCCGGTKSLKEACELRGLNLNDLILSLQELEVKNGLANENTQSLSEITEFIERRYHDDLKKRLPELVFLADKIERVHEEHSDCPHGLSEILQNLRDEMFSHMMKEENILFPMIASGNGKQAGMPINRMMFEHDSHGKELEKIYELTDSFTPPDDACGSWRALYNGLQELEAELMEHIHLENNVLFPRSLRE